MLRFLALRRSLAPALLALASAGAVAQTVSAPPAPWPTKPIRLLVGFPAGSVQDLSARAIADPLARALGQPVIVENRSGASGSIAADIVARSTDRHTFGVMNNSQLTIAKLLNPAAPYDPLRDLSPVALIATTPMVLTVSSEATGNGPQQWLAWLRQQGTNASYGSPGLGTPGHLGMELLKSRAGFAAVHVPYPGNPQIISAMLGGYLQAALLPPGLALEQVRAGKIKAIGITSDVRSPLAPGLPTLAEVGVTGGQVELWTALAGPASLPPEIRDSLAAAVMQVVQHGDTSRHLLNVGWQPAPAAADVLRVKIRDELRGLGSVVPVRTLQAQN